MNNFLNKAIESLAEEVMNEVLRGFNFNKFKAMEDPFEQLTYARKHLPFLGQGSARSVFAYSSSKVLKIAGTGRVGHESRRYQRSLARGQAQNEEEAKLYTNPKIPNDIIAIYQVDDKYNWVISEIVKPYKSAAKFEKDLNIDFDLWATTLTAYDLKKDTEHAAQKVAQWGQENNYYERTLRHAGASEEMLENPEQLAEWLQTDIMSKYMYKLCFKLIDLGLLSGDLTAYDHWGRTADGQIKLLDYGYSEEVRDQHYV